MREEQRQAPRTAIRMTVRITFADGTMLEAETWDLSDSGVGIEAPESPSIDWQTGMKVKGKVQGLPVDGPELPMEVTRVDGQRIGFKLI